MTYLARTPQVVRSALAGLALLFMTAGADGIASAYEPDPQDPPKAESSEKGRAKAPPRADAKSKAKGPTVEGKERVNERAERLRERDKEIDRRMKEKAQKDK